MTITLIRHGKTIANEQHLYCGSTDLPLSQIGIEELMAKKEIYPKASTYITSGMLRTNQTLHHIFGDVAYTIVENLREIDFGDFEMHSFEQLSHNADYQHWISNIEHNTPKNGQSKPDFIKQVITGFNEAVAICSDSAVVVTHGGVIAVIMESLFPQKQGFYDWLPAFGHGYTLSFSHPDNIHYFTNLGG